MAKLHPSIGILYIALGRYDRFWERFHASMEKNFIPGSAKHYLIYTDHPRERFTQENVTIIPRARRGWPYDTLLRFRFFDQTADILQQFDYLFFCNANTEVVSVVDDDILPTSTVGLAAAIHPAFHAKDPAWFPYERRGSSTAMVPFWKGRRYFTGGFNGGCTKDFLSMCSVLARNIDADLSAGVIARWHDESHLNAYLSDRPVRALHPGYFCPSNRRLPYERKIVALNKGDPGVLRDLREMSPGQKASERSLSLQTPVLWSLRRIPINLRRKIMRYMHERELRLNIQTISRFSE